MQVNRKKLSRYRPRFVTLLVFCVVAAMIALANLSFDQPSIRTRFVSYFHHRSYGWPIIWHRLVLHSHYNALGPRSIVGWYYSAPRLAANIVLWLILLTASSGTCEWLMRRYRPRPRWSMRTLLVFVAMLAGVCAWYAKARNRAALQDEIFAQSTSVERWGPKWLDLLGVDRFRRRTVGAELPYMRTIDEWELLQLARLPDLRFLELCGDELTPAAATTLGGMRQLRTLRVWLSQGPAAPSLPTALDGLRELRSLSIKLGDVSVTEPPTAGDDDVRLADECLVAISQMPRLEALSLSNLPLRGESLARLSNVKGLKSLQVHFWSGDWNGPQRRKPDPEGCLRAIGTLSQLEWLSLRDLGLEQPLEVPNESLAYLAGLTELHTLSLSATEHRPMLSHLPPLPRLEALDLPGVPVDDDDLRRLSLLPRLKSLSLGHSVFSPVELLCTRAGVAELASAPLLEELCLEGESAEHLLGLLALKRLKRLYLRTNWSCLLDDLDDEKTARVFGLEDYRRAFVALRESNPGIMIIDGEETPMFQRMPARDTPELGVDEYDTDPKRPSSWVPGSDMKWMTPQELANFEKLGGRASFYGVTWLQNGRLVTVEFDTPQP